MFSYFLIALFLLKTVSPQINGEFWWLHKKVAKLQQVEPPQPEFDDVNEFDTDESVKVVFKDNEIYSTKEINDNVTEIESFLNQGEVLPIVIFFQDQRELATPITLKNSTFIKKNTTNIQVSEVYNQSTKKNETYLINNNTHSNEDEFEFIFPKNDDLLWEDKIKNYTKTTVFNDSKIHDSKNIYKPNTIKFHDKVWFEEGKKQFESESICTFMMKHECITKNGIVNVPRSYPRKVTFETQKICCILPLPTKAASKIRYPHTFDTFGKRYKRSESGDKLSSILRQRNALLLRNHSQIQKNKPALKIVTPDYVDPYWNVKNSKFKIPSTPSGQDYQSPDYVDDYTAELPRPGLVGIYSENGKLQGETSWKVRNIRKGLTYYDDTYEVSEEDGDDESDIPLGYSTFDPRLGVSTNKPRPIRRKSMRVTTPRVDTTQNSESQTINFHSTPDFHVLQGFKLINLAGNKNRYVRKTTTERFYENDEEESMDQSLSVINSDDEYIDSIDVEQQVYKRCGKIVKNTLHSEKDVTENGCDPWLAIVVATKNPESILCYATIVHPRAAVTAADCVQRKAVGEVTVISGVWDLKQDRENSQQRMSTIHVHKQFSAGDLANNLAILHWKRPLRIDPKVQPACLGDPHIGDSCYFVGWGGYDQALQPRPHWQHATILTPRDCDDKISSPDINIPTGAFCASVKTRGTVTGVGGPLLCKTGNRISIVGMAVYRESVVVMLPIYKWIISALRDLQIN